MGFCPKSLSQSKRDSAFESPCRYDGRRKECSGPRGVGGRVEDGWSVGGEQGSGRASISLFFTPEIVRAKDLWASGKNVWCPIPHPHSSCLCPQTASLSFFPSLWVGSRGYASVCTCPLTHQHCRYCFCVPNKSLKDKDPKPGECLSYLIL